MWRDNDEARAAQLGITPGSCAVQSRCCAPSFSPGFKLKTRYCIMFRFTLNLCVKGSLVNLRLNVLRGSCREFRPSDSWNKLQQLRSPEVKESRHMVILTCYMLQFTGEFPVIVVSVLPCSWILNECSLWQQVVVVFLWERDGEFLGKWQVVCLTVYLQCSCSLPVTAAAPLKCYESFEKLRGLLHT